MPQGEPAEGDSSNLSMDEQRLNNIRMKSDRASFLNGAALENSDENQI